MWNVSVGSPDAERRLLKQRAKLDSYCSCIKNSLESNLDYKLPELAYDLNLKQYWNCAVFITFNTLSNLDAKQLYDKSVKSVNDLFDSQPSDTPNKAE